MLALSNDSKVFGGISPEVLNPILKRRFSRIGILLEIPKLAGEAGVRLPDVRGAR